MGLYKEQELDEFFYNAFIQSLDDSPGWFESLFGTDIETIKSNPKYYYDLDIKRDKKPEKVVEVKVNKSILKTEGLF